MILKHSLKYWKKHIKSLLLVIVGILLVVSCLNITGLFLRSFKMMILTDELDILGDYDISIHNVTKEVVNDRLEYDRISEKAVVYTINDVYLNDERIDAGCFGDEDSERIFHLTPHRGSVRIIEQVLLFIHIQAGQLCRLIFQEM